MTGAMYDILMALSDHYINAGRTAKQAFWMAIDRMQRMAIQPLDLLPPVDVTFRLFGQLAEGTEAWSETHSGVQLDEGRFSVALGSVTALGIDFSVPMFLEIQVGTELLTPRLPMRSVPSAIRAATATTVDAGAVDTAALAADAVTKA